MIIFFHIRTILFIHLTLTRSEGYEQMVGSSSDLRSSTQRISVSSTVDARPLVPRSLAFGIITSCKTIFFVKISQFLSILVTSEIAKFWVTHNKRL